jgi:hypothetical protein
VKRKFRGHYPGFLTEYGKSRRHFDLSSLLLKCLICRIDRFLLSLSAASVWR